jgi:hypothetical protein
VAGWRTPLHSVASVSRDATGARRHLDAVEAIRHSISQVVRGTGSTAFTLIGAVVLGFGVPAGWLWLASQLSGKIGAVDTPVIAFIATGIIVTYWIVLVLASWIRARLVARWEEPHPRRQSWNRSMRDSPFRPGSARGDPIERLFVATTVITGIAFIVWFALFAGAPFPTNPG